MRVETHLKTARLTLIISILFFLVLIIIFTASSCKTAAKASDETSSQSSQGDQIEDSLSGDNSISDQSIQSSQGEKIEDNLSGDNSVSDQSSQENDTGKQNWGPLQLRSGNIRNIYIKGKIGIGSVLYDTGGSLAGTTYVYALDISDGKIIGEAVIKGSVYNFDICENYAFIWVEDGINIYDLKKDFEFVKTLPARWTSNLGSYFFVEDRNAPDYLIDKRTLNRKDLKIPDDNYVFALLYPDCLIGDPYAFDGGRQGDPVIYDIESGAVLGSLKNGNAIVSAIFAWDHKSSLVFYRGNGKTNIYNVDKGALISELPYEPYNTDEPNRSVAVHAFFGSLPDLNYYAGNGDRLRVIRDFSVSENGYYFINFLTPDGTGICYALDSYGKVKWVIEDSKIFGEAPQYVFFDQEESISANKDSESSIWLKAKPLEPYMGTIPYITSDSLAWLDSCSGLKGHGDALCQWDYKTGSFLNYTEFTNYEVVVLSENPLILGMRDYREGAKGTWTISRSNPTELPFNVEADIQVDYSPDDIYPQNTTVNFRCALKNVPAELQTQPVTFDWDFGDGTKGTGKETGHIYEKGGKYQASVKVRLGSSAGSTSKSVEVAVLESPEIVLTATPKSITSKSVNYFLACRVNNLIDLSKIEWNFGDGATSSGDLGVYHTYELGEYKAKVKVYIDANRYFEKEVDIKAAMPDFSVTASPDEGLSALTVDFKCSILSNEITDSNLKYAWKINAETINTKKSFQKDFIELGSHIVKLEIRDQENGLISERTLIVDVYKPTLTVSDGGRKIASNASIFVDHKDDADKDGINQVFEDLAMVQANPNFELDEGEEWLTARYTKGDKVINFVRITPYPSISNPQYILFVYAMAWSRDYGRYEFIELEAHTGDVEKVVMAWKVNGDKNLELKYVYTSAHGGAPTNHCGIWKAKGETTNWGKVKFGDEEEFSATLEFIDNTLQLQVSEDKHAVYPTKNCGNDVVLVIGGFGEDCGGGDIHSFVPYNAGEPGAPLMDDINNIFPNERIWSGNINYPGNFCGGLKYDGSPGTIGNTLNDTAMLEDVLYKDIYGIHHPYQ